MRWLTMHWIKRVFHATPKLIDKSKRPRCLLTIEQLEDRCVPSVNPLSANAFQHAPVSTTSTNWSGYAAQTNLNNPQSGAVTGVGGSWIVPTVMGNGYSAVWVGIDGYSSPTVEQLGTEEDIVNGH